MRSLFTGSIVRSLKDRFYRIASRDAARRGGETIVVTYQRCISTRRLVLSFSLFHPILSSSFSSFLSLFFHFFPCRFLVSEGPTTRAAAVHLSLSDQPRSRPASFAVVHALARTLLPFTRPSSSPCHSPTSRSLLVTLFLTLSLSKAVSRPLPSTPPPLLSFSLSLSGDDGLARRTT